MTSAFIIPDITMHSRDATATAKDLLHGTNHDMKNCSVCQRILSSAPVDIEDLDIPIPVPVTLRKEYKENVDATLRPSQPAVNSLTRVMKELNDELIHLKLHFKILERQVSTHDPALGSRKSASLHRKIEKVSRAIKAKTGQLYSLYDVLEAHKEEIERGEEVEEVERTLENVLEERGRRVEFESEDEAGEGSEWIGLSDTTRIIFGL